MTGKLEKDKALAKQDSLLQYQRMITQLRQELQSKDRLISQQQHDLLDRENLIKSLRQQIDDQDVQLIDLRNDQSGRGDDRDDTLDPDDQVSGQGDREADPSRELG